MEYYNLSALVEDTENADVVLQSGALNDSGSYKTTFDQAFKYSGFDIKYLTANGDGIVYMSQNTGTSSSYSIGVNQRDMSSWTIWKQTGIIRRIYSFTRLHWEGYAHYNTKTDPNRLAFDLIFLSDHKIYLYIADWPTENATGSNYLKCGSSINVTFAPAQDGDWFTFTPADENGGSWTVESGLQDPEYPDIRYLLRSSGKLYNVENNAPVELSDTELTAAVFETSGMTTLPSYQDYKELGDVDILTWMKEEYSLSTLTRTGTPSYMDVTTNDIAVGFPANRVWIDGSENTKYQVSFDGGQTWEYYKDDAFVDGTEDIQNGNTPEELKAVPMSVLQEKITESKIRFRCRMTSMEEYLSSINIGNQKSYEDVYGEACPY